MLTLLPFLLAGTAASALIPRDDGGECYGKNGEGYKHAAIFSFDGLHASDVDKYLALKGPSSNLSKILEHSHRFTGAYTSFPSDSFPGSMGLFTGASPKTHGVWYDDVWDRSLWAPGSNCTGASGAESEFSFICPQCFTNGRAQSSMTKQLMSMRTSSSAVESIPRIYP